MKRAASLITAIAMAIQATGVAFAASSVTPQHAAVEHFNSSNALLRKETNEYDPASRITSRYEGPATGGTTTTFGYDDIGQLMSEDSTGYSADYDYDANGNRTLRTVNGVSETYTCDDADKLTSVTWSSGGNNYAKEYAYHYSGRPTSITYKTNGVTTATETMTWDKESRMLTNSLANSSYVYNGFDARVSKTVGANTTTFKRAGADPVSPVLSDVLGSTTTRHLPGISSQVGSASTFLHSGIKNGILQTNSSQSNTATKRYDAFGNELSSSGTWQTRFDYGGAFGYQRDDESGYKLLGHRYYDKSTGRFLTCDPIKDGRNWYAYCASGPVDATDPEGTWFWKLWDVVDVVTDPGDPLNWIGLVDPSPTTRIVKLGKRARKLGEAYNDVAKRVPPEALKTPPVNRRKPPLGNDKHPLELHHKDQKPGKLKVMTRTEHRGKGNFKENHPNLKGPSKIDRNRARKEREDFWKEFWNGLFPSDS
jgi:RHS repeat-associated protein